MKKSLTIFMALAAFSLLLSCNDSTSDDNTPQGKDPKISVQTATVNVGAEGGNGEILYSIENAVEWVALEASCDAEWVSEIDCSVANKVTFLVSPNNLTEERTAPVTLKYGAVTATAQIVQAGKEPSEYAVDIELPKFYGIYYGDYFMPGVGNYWFYLMDKDMVNDVMSPEGNYYRVDLYGALAEDSSAAFVPDGTYTFDPTSSCASGTFTKSYSYLVTTDAAGKGTTHDYTDGVLTVKNEGGNCSFELIVTIEGQKHRITYNGPTPFMDDSGSDEPEADYPQIQENIDMNVVNADAYWVDSNGEVASVDITLMDMEKDSEGYPVYPGVSLDIEMFSILESDGSIHAGEYVISADNAGADGTLTPGSISSFIGIVFPSGTNVQQFDAEGNRTFGPVTQGTLKVSGDASNMSIEVDFTMEGNHTFKATYNGPLQVKNLPSGSSVTSVRAPKSKKL